MKPKVLTTTADFGDVPEESSVQVQSGNVQSQPPAPAATQSDEISLIKDAQEYMGPLMVDFFEGNMTGSEGSLSLTKSQSQFLGTMGPWFLNITPYNDSGSNNKQKIELHNSMNSKLLNNLFLSAFGPYFTQTDILDKSALTNNTPYTAMSSIFPESEAITNFLRYYTNNLGSTHPIMIVMGMNPEYRAIAGLAIKDAIYTDKINEDEILCGLSKEHITRNLMPLESLLKTAETYKQKDIKPVIENYNQTIAKYLSKWNGR